MTPAVLGDVPRFLPPLLSQVQADWMVPTGRCPTREHVAKLLAAPPQRIRVVTRYWWPPRSEHLHAFAAEVLRWGSDMQPGDWIYWVHPVAEVPITDEEAEQIIGLAASPALIERDQLADGSACLVVAGKVRLIATAVAVAWPRAVLVDRDLLTAALERVRQAPPGIRNGLHCVGVPASSGEWHTFDAALTALLQVAKPREGARFGIYAETATETVGAVVERLDASINDPEATVRCQWRAAGTTPESVKAPEALFPGAQIDCSLGADSAEHDLPYYTDRPYDALAFDLRRPTVVPTRHTVMSWPRAAWPPERSGWCAPAVYERLAPVLDRPTQLAYLAELAQDRTRVDEWHRYHVYNWAPPPADMVRLLACRVHDVDRLAALLANASAPVLPAGQAIALATAIAKQGAVADAQRARAAQIAAHGYLAEGGRHEITADGEALIARLPDALGDTLEIGFGYGLTARRVASRARRYVGIDLKTEQGRKLREYGGAGLVADIHWLPLAANTFDTVIADNVLEHAGDPIAVLTELGRVLRPGGRLYALIPPDGVTSEYQIRTHFWKSDAWSLREAARRASLDVVTLEWLDYAALGVYGCFPASQGRTCLTILERPATAPAHVPGARVDAAAHLRN